MPLKINGDINSLTKASKQIYSAKFFSKDITGSGKAAGLLNQSMFPVNLSANTPINSIAPKWDISSDTNKYSKTTTYPLNPLGSYIPVLIPGALNFDTSWCRLSANFNVSSTHDSYAAIVPVSFSIIEPLATQASNGNTQSNSSAAVNAQTPASASASSGKRCSIKYVLLIMNVEKNNKQVTISRHFFTENPMKSFEAIYGVTSSDIIAFQTYLSSYNTHAEICRQSEIWQTNLVDVIMSAYDKDPTNFPMSRIIRYIAQYKVSLQQYKDLYAALKQRFNSDDIKKFTKMNTSLLLQDTLDNLSQTQFTPLPTIGSSKKPIDLSWCSFEQFNAITSSSPLNQVQAGAGTGKSTVIKARLDYLDSLGVDLNKVMVLSFTNAAADNIKARCPGIQSMTIAKMIDTIYTKNHPTHQLSSSLARRGEGSTFTNSLELYRNSLPLIPELIAAVNRVEKNNDYATLLRLVEENYNDIMKILDTVGQTTFQLEIIICYLEYATMTIPFDIEHLLIDEVQDNAVFEFIFFLNLTCKLKNHLYLVGDCSQTLYEFRASDPKALNTIESCGLFATFPLNINYRSNQNILHFANSLLNDIEANQYANIQLQSFELNTITKQSFEEAVVVNYSHLYRISDMEDTILGKLKSPDMQRWIDDKLAKNEQICVLSYKRRDAVMIQKKLEELYPGKSFVSIIPAKNTSVAYFSKYVSANRLQLMALPTSNATDLCKRVRLEIIANLTGMHITPQSKNYSYVLTSVTKMLDEWQAANLSVISDAITQFNTGVITHERLAEIVGETLINYEIQKNALKQSLVSQRNADKKESTNTANFIFSTIHSAKGLEFDNVILLYQNKNQMEEEEKRMYYVALTRAKKCEYVLAYDTATHAVIQTRYDTIVARLPDEDDVLFASTVVSDDTASNTDTNTAVS